MEESIKASELRLKKAFKSTKYALKTNKRDLQNRVQTHEDEFGDEFDLNISQIAKLPNIEQVRRYHVPPNPIAKVLRTSHKDELVAYP